MPVWQQEMGWHCGTCEKLNRGRYKECQNCGKAKEGEPFVDLPNESEGIAWAVRAPELIKQAEAGSDWECRFCSSHQRRDNGDCAQCGAKQGDSRSHPTKWDDGTVGPSGEGATVLEELQSEARVVDAELRVKTRKERQHRIRRPQPVQAPQPVQTEDTHSPISMPVHAWWTRERKITSWALLGVATFGLLLFVLFRTHEVDATVTSLHWKNTVTVEREQIEVGHGFDENQPEDAFDVTPEGSRHHHYRKVKTGTHQVPYKESYSCGETCTTTPVRCDSNGNGFKTCSGGDRVCTPQTCTRTKYRTEDIYKDVSVEETYYSWRVWRWSPHRTLNAEGTTTITRWPSPEEVRLNKNLPSGVRQERARQSSDFDVFFEASDKTFTYHPKTSEEFERFPIGTKRRLRVGIMRSTEVIP